MTDLDLQSRSYAAAWEMERHVAGTRYYSPLSTVEGGTCAVRHALDGGPSPLWGASSFEEPRESTPRAAPGNPGFGPLSADYRWKF